MRFIIHATGKENDANQLPRWEVLSQSFFLLTLLRDSFDVCVTFV